MSRSCMYCGRELAKDERCSCPQSVRMRREKEASQQTGSGKTADNPPPHSDTKKQKASRSEKKQNTYRAKRRERVRTERRRPNTDGGANGFFRYVLSCVRNPVFKASNPGFLRLWWIWALVGINGFAVSAALFLSGSAMKKGLFGILSMALGFKGIDGWKNLLQLLFAALSGAAMGYIMFFGLCGVFFLVGKLTLRSASRYVDYMERFAPCTIPLTLIGILGILLAVFSPTTLWALLACGAGMEIILLYEALRSHWNTQPDFTVYTLVGGLFIWTVLCCNIYKLFIM